MAFAREQTLSGGMCRFCGRSHSERNELAENNGWDKAPVCDPCVRMLLQIDSLPIWGLGQLVTEIAHGKRDRLALMARALQAIQERDLDEAPTDEIEVPPDDENDDG